MARSGFQAFPYHDASLGPAIGITAGNIVYVSYPCYDLAVACYRLMQEMQTVLGAAYVVAGTMQGIFA